MRKSRQSTYSTTYGINQRSPLNGLVGFDVTQCFPFDVMHSIFEGVAIKHLNLLLCHLIDHKKCLGIDDLNHILKSHPYGSSETDTKPSLIYRDKADSDFKIKQSG